MLFLVLTINKQISFFTGNILAERTDKKKGVKKTGSLSRKLSAAMGVSCVFVVFDCGIFCVEITFPSHVSFFDRNGAIVGLRGPAIISHLLPCLIVFPHRRWVTIPIYRTGSKNKWRSTLRTPQSEQKNLKSKHVCFMLAFVEYLKIKFLE